MQIFSVVFLKTISVLLSAAIGFFAGKYANVTRDSIANLLFYFIAPIVFFSVPANTTLSISSLGISLVTFVIASFLSITAYYVSKKYWQDKSVRGIVSLSAGAANAGYFMLPIATALFDDYTLGVYMMAVVGVSIYEASVGFYFCVRSVSSTRSSVMNILKSPLLNAFALGCLLSFLGLNTPDFLDDFFYNIRGAYSILGMIMIGIAVSDMSKFEIDKKFTIFTFVNKFIVYPLIIVLFVALDKFILKIYDESYYNALYLLSTAPMAGNLIVITTIRNINPEKIVATVLMSFIFVLIYMPVMIGIYFA